MVPARRLLRQVVCVPIKLYQYLISPFLGNHCRFHPSCSEYAIEAITHKGIARGMLLAVYRLCRCHPGSRGGYDPVQLSKEK